MSKTTKRSKPSASLRDNLRQMVAVLQEERQALSELDLDGIMGSAYNKTSLCDTLESSNPAEIDEECRGLLEAAKRLNEVNRQVRNLISANVAARLEALTGRGALYRAPGAPAAYAYAGARG